VSRKRKEGHRKRRRRLRASIRQTTYVVAKGPGQQTALFRHVSPSLPGILGGRAPSALEVAWQDEPGITVQTDPYTGLPTAKVWGDSLPDGAYRAMLRRDPCAYCGKMPVPLGDPQWRFRRGSIEHLHRIADGGGGLLENIVGACSHCNSTRGERSVLENLAVQRNTVLYPPRLEWPEAWRVVRRAA